MHLRPWIMAARLRTLPLTVSNIFLGSMIALSRGSFNLPVFLLGLLTAILLQILSNFANDYGDFVSGADEKRVSSFERALQSGQISALQMRIMLIVLSLLTLVTGIYLILISAELHGREIIFPFLILGVFCILAALMYTIGKKPYGYLGLGDISVFLFFGIIGVGGIYLLHTGIWRWDILLPASAFGLMSAGVLNINNIRDFESDRLSGKKTIVVRIGIRNAKTYYIWLITLALVLVLISTFLNLRNVFQLIYLPVIPLFILNVKRVVSADGPVMFDRELKNLAMLTFLFSLAYGLGLIF